jgi:methyltransferase (TIGR00027 family)
MQDEKALLTTLNAFYAKMGRELTKENAHAYAQSARAYLVVWSRYIEDELGKALERGVSEYVILGAGLDSFAFRRQDIENKLRVFEVDHPATQNWKKIRLRELDINQPCNLTFVPVDFEKQRLIDELQVAGFQLDIPVFFSMLGVAHYLSQAAVFQILNEVANMAPGSEIIFDYMLTDSLLYEQDPSIVAWGKSRDRRQKWVSQFDPLTLAERLREMGFIEVFDSGREEANTYLAGRSDKLSPSCIDELPYSALRMARIFKARVGSKR